MTTAACPRLFEVASARDGRLVGAELASFERHRAACPACLREAEALEAPAVALQATLAGQRDELHVRRERTRLLAAFDGGLVAPQQRWSRLLLWPVPVATLLVGLFIFWGPWRTAPKAMPSAVVRASSTAVWSEQMLGDLEQIRLQRGSLWLRVDHVSKRTRRLVVSLPDGELEDTGTTFTVTTDGARTTLVEVQEGSVVLRVRGELAVAIGAGGTWSPTRATPVAATSAPLADPTASGRATQPVPNARASSPSAPLATAVSDPAADFRAAMATLDAGNDVEAAVAFGSFIAKHPRDPRAEDAAYLRIIVLRRGGDEGGMKQAAAAYLLRYPAGFRHAEVETLSR